MSVHKLLQHAVKPRSGTSLVATCQKHLPLFSFKLATQEASILTGGYETSLQTFLTRLCGRPFVITPKMDTRHLPRSFRSRGCRSAVQVPPWSSRRVSGWGFPRHTAPRNLHNSQKKVMKSAGTQFTEKFVESAGEIRNDICSLFTVQHNFQQRENVSVSNFLIHRCPKAERKPLEITHCGRIWPKIWRLVKSCLCSRKSRPRGPLFKKISRDFLEKFALFDS